MKVRPKDGRSCVTNGTVVTGEALSFEIVDGHVYFKVVWTGRPGVHTVHSTQVVSK